MDNPCVSDPPNVGTVNKEKERKESESEEMPQTMDDVDLEEGEIIDSCGEGNYAESDKELVKKLSGLNAPSDNAIGQILEAGDELDGTSKKKKRKKKKKRIDDDGDGNESGKPKKKKRYIDHDRVDDDDEDSWLVLNSMPYSKKNFKRKLDDGQSSPGPYDSSYYSPDMKSSSQDEGNCDGQEQKVRKTLRKTGTRRQALERGTKKKRKDSMNRGGPGSKKRLSVNKNKKKAPKTKPRPFCKFFLEGRCSKGPDCPFSHATQPSMKKELCKFYVNGYCAKGSLCLYMHDDFPCKFFHTGAKCYSEANCIFSHDPLTEETRKLLDKHLENSKNEDGIKDGSSNEDAPPSPPKQQPKRPSLLGSPPRHVKEAAKDWRWQQHILQMQQRRYNGPRNAPMLSPPHSFSRPNFYMDTLPRSPSKIPSLMSMPPINMPNLNPNVRIPPLLDIPALYPPVPEGESSSQEEWENDKHTHKQIETQEPENQKTIQGADNAKAATLDNSETKIQNNTKEIENTGDESLTKPKISEAGDNTIQIQETQLSANSPPTEMIQLLPTLVIPTHLPRRQRELYLRIQQHQKEADSGTDGGENSEDPEAKAEDEEKKENWYSSDEDDTEDLPLTAVLKKLREMPPPNRSHQSIGHSFSSNSTIDITKMLSEIRQQATQTPGANGNNNNQQNDFWQNLLSGATPFENIPVQNNPGSRDPRIRLNPVKPQNLSGLDSTNKSPPFRDPRLQNRDPRLASRDPRAISVTNPSSSSSNIIVPPRQAPEKISQPSIWEIPTMNKANDIIADNNKGTIGTIPYKLRSIKTSPPNYSSYVFQCQSDPKLLNDPRLKKYFKQMSGLLRQQQHLTDDTNNLNLDQNKKNQIGGQIKVNVNTSESSGHFTNAETWDHLSKPKSVDSRAMKIPINPPRPRQTGSTTPPHNPPTSEWTTTTMNATSTVTNVISHLPRSVSDPRLTRLLTPSVDHRRTRSQTDQPQQDTINNPPALPKKQTNIASTPVSPTVAIPKPLLQPPIKETVLPSISNNNGKDPPPTTEETNSNSSEENTEKKKKLTSFNRKSSMDYASPLSSYEDSSSSGTSYNSYSRRPQVTQTAATSKTQSNIPQPSPPSTTSVDIGHSSLESSGHSQSLSFLVSETPVEAPIVAEHTPSLKEVFKTIDPTASPFC